MLKTQVLENASTEKASTKQRISPVLENARTENAITNEQGWKTQVRKTQVRICNGGKRNCSNRKSILKSLRFSSLAFSVDPLSVGLDQITCTVPDRCYTQEIGLMLDSCAEVPEFTGATLSSNSLSLTVLHPLYLCSSSSEIGSSPLKGYGGNYRPGGK